MIVGITYDQYIRRWRIGMLFPCGLLCYNYTVSMAEVFYFLFLFFIFFAVFGVLESTTLLARKSFFPLGTFRLKAICLSLQNIAYFPAVFKRFIRIFVAKICTQNVLIVLYHCRWISWWCLYTPSYPHILTVLRGHSRHCQSSIS